jgi:AcrR family transcriptional regulator
VTAVTRDDNEAARQHVLAAAKRVLAAQGAAGLTVRNVAAEAGCSTMVVYTRFGSKQALVDAIYRDGFHRLRDTISSARRSSDPLQDLRSCGRAYRRFALENPTDYEVMFERAVPDHEPSDDARADALAAFDALVVRVQRAVDGGGLAGEPRAIAAMLWAANHGAVSIELHGSGPPDLDWASLHPGLVTYVLDAAVAPSRRRRD